MSNKYRIDDEYQISHAHFKTFENPVVSLEKNAIFHLGEKFLFRTGS